MPFKHHSACRHRISRQKFKVMNWAEYEAGLRQRGSITFWITDAAIAGWLAPRRKTPGGQPRYSDLAIEATLICGIVFHQPLRQSEGLMTVLPSCLTAAFPLSRRHEFTEHFPSFEGVSFSA